jgi:hypothetical protein
MKDLWKALEEQSRAWNTLARQGLADAIWADYVSVRFGRTGDPRALDYLYPYLNNADKQTRLQAIEVAARVFEGRGPRALDSLDYFTKNPDLFLRDRAVQIVGAAVVGSLDRVLLEVLGPYLDHRNQFVRKLALVALGKAASGRASKKILEEIQRVAQRPGPREDEVDTAIARVFASRPTEEVYGLVAKPELEDRLADDRIDTEAVAPLVRGADDMWYERACKEVFEPRLHAVHETGWWQDFIRRDGIEGLSTAGTGRGMEPLNRMLHLRVGRCTGHALLHTAQACFIGADPGVHQVPLMALARDGDIPAQRIAAVCLGRLMLGAEDEEAIGLLRELCDSRNRAVQTVALMGLGMAARSSCDESLRRLCLERAGVDETAAAALDCLGMVFLGSGRADVFEDLRAKADFFRARPVRGKRHNRPLAMCYRATGLLYLGTGSLEPVAFLLDVLALPRVSRMLEYHWRAARALVMIEFSAAALGWQFIDADTWYLPDNQWINRPGG